MPMFNYPPEDELARVESPIERIFLTSVYKYVADGVTVEPQTPISTGGGNFRADFVLASTDRRIVVECDGRDFHKDPARDRDRDRAILRASEVTCIYRMTGRSLFHHTDRLLFLLSLCEPDFFDERGLRNLLILGRTELARLELHAEIDVLVADYFACTDQEIAMLEDECIDKRDLSKTSVSLSWLGTPRGGHQGVRDAIRERVPEA